MRCSTKSSPARSGSGKLKPNESLISIEKARKVLGYSPEHDWSPGKIRAPRLERHRRAS